MSSQLESATLAHISSIGQNSLGRKIRVAGRVFSYDVNGGFIVLLDSNGKHAAVVDISGALDDRSKEWLNERMSVVIVIGYVEPGSADRVPLPPGATLGESPAQLRALLAIPAADLDFKLWNEVVDDVHQASTQGMGQ